MADYSKKLAFRNKFYNNEKTKKYFLLKENKVVGTVLEYNTPGSTEIMIYDDDENLISCTDRNPVKSGGYGLNRVADCFQRFYELYGKNITTDDLRLLGSGQISLFYSMRGITVID
jgi:hypothetical protein